jgi:hypothetical protein
MKLSIRTLQIITNFASINQGLLFRAGNVQRTISPDQSMMATATIEESMPLDFGIYDLGRFLKVLRKVGGQLRFSEEYLIMGDANKTLRYLYAPPEMLVLPPAKDIQCEFDYEFELSCTVLAETLRLADDLGLPNITFTDDGEYISIGVSEPSNPDGDGYRQIIASGEPKFKAVLKRDQWRVLPDNYVVQLSKRGLISLSSEDMTYYLSCSSSSGWE